MERITLAPGAHINVLPAEKFNRCRISINFIWPAAREWATAEALLPLVLERGYQGCPDMTELSKKLARLYGAALSVDGTMSGQSRVLTVSLSGIRDAFALAGEPLSREYADIAFGTAFEPYRVDGVLDAEAVAIEKEQLRELLEGEINEKRSYCIRQARRRFYGDSPAGIERNGYLDEVDGLTADAVTRAYARMVEQAQIEVFVLGADVDAVAQRLRTALSGLRRAPEELPAPIAMPAEEPRSFEEPLPTVQGKLCMLFTPGEPFAPQDLSALRVAVALLGGTPTSRLFQNVREKQSLCYYCAASYTSLTGALSGLRRAPEELPAPIAMPAEEPRSFEEPLPTVQGKLCMLFTPGEPFAPQDLSALRVAVALLGGTPTSRLFQNVREKQSLCYYCAASYTSLTGALCVDSGVEHANAAAARESILKELAALCAGPVEDGELADTKRALKNQLAAVGDTLQGLEGWYFAERMRGADKAPEQVAAEVDAVTADDVRRVLSRFRLSVCYTLTKEAGADA